MLTPEEHRAELAREGAAMFLACTLANYLRDGHAVEPLKWFGTDSLRQLEKALRLWGQDDAANVVTGYARRSAS